jgi:hypothetical protein
MKPSCLCGRSKKVQERFEKANMLPSKSAAKPLREAVNDGVHDEHGADGVSQVAHLP